jgi:hypothetical protein
LLIADDDGSTTDTSISRMETNGMDILDSNKTIPVL